jgi:hypothetical protein
MQEPTLSRRTIMGGVAALAVPSIARGQSTAAHTVLGRNDGVWLNAPRRWQADANGDLTLTTDRATDFWRETHYGFTRDTGTRGALRMADCESSWRDIEAARRT